MLYYKRTLNDIIAKDLESPEAIFIIGARQVGKTTLARHILENIPDEQKILIDLENPSYLDVINKGADQLLAFLDYQGLKKNKKNYIFIDEIQYADDFSGLIKYLVDHYSSSYKLILSGSSSIQIKHKFKDSLVGRKKVYELYPLSFAEFCYFKGENRIGDAIENLDPFLLNYDPVAFDRDKIHYLLIEFILFGGFPKAVLQENRKEKIEVLRDIADMYVYKDIRSIFNLEKPGQFNHLVRLLAAYTGKDINLTRLSSEIKINHQTLANYLEALEAGFVIRRVNPFYRNLASELRKMPKYYFLDTGLRNQIINNFNEPESRTDRGEMLENHIFSQLLKKSGNNAGINYWRTKQKQEIDFILEKESALTAIEVKWNREERTNLRIFKSKYPEARAFLTSFAGEFDGEAGVLPAYLI